ncbi:MAG TPA: protoglobin domain-containing protein, partial [Stellaceae bacterium]|nr:protoglobin domain-containing protein [Stellaceae bacterium]
MTAQLSIHEKLQYYRIGSDDTAALQTFRPVVEEALPRLLTGFYEFLRRFPAAAMLNDPAVANRAK